MAYNRDTSPLLPYYRGQGKLVEVDGMAPVEQVAAAIDEVLDRPPRLKRDFHADSHTRPLTRH